MSTSDGRSSLSVYDHFMNLFHSLQNIESCLGTKIKGQLDKTDSGVIYTDAYVSRYFIVVPCTDVMLNYLLGLCACISILTTIIHNHLVNVLSS